jgi:hypothetical protein
MSTAAQVGLTVWFTFCLLTPTLLNWWFFHRKG